MSARIDQIQSIFKSHEQAYMQGKNRSYQERKGHLLALKSLITENEEKILEALRKDLGKCSFEGAISETLFTINEIEHTLKKLKKYMKKKWVFSPMLQFPVWSRIKPEPLGKVLIISPWNYPFQLLMSPLIGALAAGNVVILKPSEVAHNVSEVVAELVPRYFPQEVVAVVEGAVEETQALLSLPFDHIFYTGNGTVGRIVMEKAAQNLCPVTLELGGKSPCVIVGNNDLDLVAKRLVWGKFLNAGQTCVAPDYVLVQEEQYPKLVENLKKYIKEFFGDNPKDSQDYGKIINGRHLKRLISYIKQDELIFGGVSDEASEYLSPTLLRAGMDSPAMKEEIFGPILPLLTIKNFDEALAQIRKNPNPLAAYIFTQDNHFIDRFIEEVPSGGQCINDSIVHLTNPNLPFGGRGASGMGSYHGKKSFETFSHMKSIMGRGTFLDLPVRYPPYKGKLGLIRWLLSWFG